MTHGIIRRLTVVSAIAFILLASMPAVSADAYEAEESSYGVHFATSGELSQTDIDRLFDDHDWFASFAMMSLLVDTSVMHPYDTSLSGMAIEASAFDRVSGTARTEGAASVIETDISFTIKGEGRLFSLIDEDLIPLYELFGRNALTSDDRIDVSGHLTMRLSEGYERSYERNAAGDFVLTYDETGYSYDIRADGMRMRMFHGEELKGEVTVESRVREIRNLSTDVTFPDTKAEDADAGTYVYNIQGFPGCYSLWDFDYSGDAEGSYKVYFTDDEYRDYHEHELADRYCLASVLDSDIAASPKGCSDLFAYVGDPALLDESALRAYLGTIGTVSDSFQDAEALYDDVSKGPTYSNVRRVMLIGAIGVMLTVAALGLLFFFARRN